MMTMNCLEPSEDEDTIGADVKISIYSDPELHQQVTLALKGGRIKGKITAELWPDEIAAVIGSLQEHLRQIRKSIYMDWVGESQ